MPPINLYNYSVMRDWYDNSLWIKPHSKDTANRPTNPTVKDYLTVQQLINRRNGLNDNQRSN